MSLIPQALIHIKHFLLFLRYRCSSWLREWTGMHMKVCIFALWPTSWLIWDGYLAVLSLNLFACKTVIMVFPAF